VAFCKCADNSAVAAIAPRISSSTPKFKWVFLVKLFNCDYKSSTWALA
jgi:hypothetical protein